MKHNNYIYIYTISVSYDWSFTVSVNWWIINLTQYLLVFETVGYYVPAEAIRDENSRSTKCYVLYSSKGCKRQSSKSIWRNSYLRHTVRGNPESKEWILLTKTYILPTYLVIISWSKGWTKTAHCWLLLYYIILTSIYYYILCDAYGIFNLANCLLCL